MGGGNLRIGQLLPLRWVKFKGSCMEGGRKLRGRISWMERTTGCSALGLSGRLTTNEAVEEGGDDGLRDDDLR